MPCFPAKKTHFAVSQQQVSSTALGKGGVSSAQLQSSRCAATSGRGAAKNRLIKEHELCHWYDGDATIRQQGPRRRVVKREPMLTAGEITRLRSAAKMVSLEAQLDALAKQEENNKQLEREMELVRQKFRRIDDTRQRLKEQKTQSADSPQETESAQVLERAFLAKHEQEEEVKNVDRIILNAKCHAVRDAQIQEKLVIERTRKENDLRLEQIVLENAKRSLADEDDEVERLRVGKARYASQIKQQLSERERIRFLEAEFIEDEARRIRLANEAIRREDAQQAQRERERRAKLRAELDRIAEMSNLFKRMKCEQEAEAEMRVAAYQREKAERERQLQHEQKLAKEAFERRQQRIYTLAQKIFESKSQREEQRYLREQEQIDREYRQRELEAAQRKRRIEQELRDAREMQLQQTKNRQAAQIARAEKEFNELIDIIKAEDAKQSRADEERRRQRNCYRREIVRQINSKDLERRQLEELEKQRIFAWREGERQRDKNIRAVINAKLNAMRGACLPEKYIKEVEMQLQRLTSKVPM